MNLENEYLDNLYYESQQIRSYNNHIFECFGPKDACYRRAKVRDITRNDLVKNIFWCQYRMSHNKRAQIRWILQFFLNIMWLDNPKIPVEKWYKFNFNDDNLTEYLNLFWDKIKDNTIDENFMKDMEVTIKMVS